MVLRHLHDQWECFQHHFVLGQPWANFLVQARPLRTVKVIKHPLLDKSDSAESLTTL